MGAMTAAARTTASASTRSACLGQRLGCGHPEHARQQCAPHQHAERDRDHDRHRHTDIPQRHPEHARAPRRPAHRRPRQCAAPDHEQLDTQEIGDGHDHQPDQEADRLVGIRQARDTQQRRHEAAGHEHQPEQQQWRGTAVAVGMAVGSGDELIPGSCCQADTHRHDARKRHERPAGRQLGLGSDEQRSETADAEQPRAKVERRDGASLQAEDAATRRPGQHALGRLVGRGGDLRPRLESLGLAVPGSFSGRARPGQRSRTGVMSGPIMLGPRACRGGPSTWSGIWGPPSCGCGPGM